jgi:adenylate cyclase
VSRPSGHGASRRRLVFLCGIAPVFCIAVLAIYRPPFLARLDDAIYDVVLRSARPHPPDGRIVIIDLDERSLSTMGQWPWPRDLVARLLTGLRDLGVSTIAMDVVFAEPDRYASGRMTDSSPDQVLADTLGAGDVILGYGLTFDPGGAGRGSCVLHPIALPVLRPNEETNDAPFFRATGCVCSLPMLATAAGASGFLNAAPDSDGILRRVPLVIELGGRVYPSLALRAVMDTIGAKEVDLRISNVNSAVLTVDERTIPVDARSNLLLRFRGEKRTFPYVSAADVLSGTVRRDALRDKIAFVGTTALGTREVVATPLDTLFAGVEVQATVADNLLQQDFLRRSAVGNVLDSMTALLLGVGLAIVVATAGVTAGVVSAVVALAGLWWSSVSLVSSSGLFMSPLLPALSVLSALAVMTFVKFTIERRRAETAGREKATAQRLMIQTLLSLTEVRDAETGRHSRRTQRYARLLAEQLSQNPDFRDYLTPERIDLLSNLAPLHDIGKVGIPDHILNKPGALTSDELSEMRKHPTLGREVILKAEQRVDVRDDATLAMAKEIVYTHHERWDGTGYPQGLRGNNIPIAGRVMAIVDVYDAAVGRSVYRPSISHEDAVKLITSGKGSHFDPAVVEAFVAIAPEIRTVAQEVLTN